jgi:hypothetical protein
VDTYLKNQKLLLTGFVYLTAVSLIVIFAISLFLQSQAVEYVMETSFPEVDSTFPILIVKDSTVTPESVTEIGKSLGFTGEAGPAGEGMIGMLSEDETKHLLAYENSGTVFYSVLEKMHPVVTSQPDLPSDDDAVKIAQSFLAERNLLPPDAKLDKVVADKQNGYNTVLQVVASGRYINGIPIVGPGNKLSVYVGEKGEVVGFLKAWKDVEISKKAVNIKTAETAFDDMKKGNVIFATPDVDNIDIVNIKDVYIAYWVESETQEQDSALPVYVFKGEYVYDNSQIFPFTAYVQATVDESNL